MRKRYRRTGSAPTLTVSTEVPPEQAAPVPQGPGWTFATSGASTFRIARKFHTSAELLSIPGNIPKVLVSRLAIHKIFFIVGAIELEVGWLGTARQNGSTITIDDVFLFKQDVSFGHTALDEGNMADIMVEVVQKPGGEEIFNNTKFWGHSHGSGSTFPSMQDDTQMEKFRKQGAEFFLRGIFNRRGEISFSVFDWKRGVAFHNVPWNLTGRMVSETQYREIREEMRAEMLAKVTYSLRPPPPPAPTNVVVPQSTYAPPHSIIHYLSPHYWLKKGGS